MQNRLLKQIHRESFFSFNIISPPESRDFPEKMKDLPGNSALILCAEKDAEDEQLRFLENVLNAIELNLDQNAFLISLTESEKFGFSPFFESPAISLVLVFGLSSEMIGLQLKTQPYQLFSFRRKQFLFADPLSEIEQKQSLKRMLWKELKKVRS